MRAKIIKIHPPKQSRFENVYIRIEFLLENGEWAKSDIVTSYRNYKNWKPFIAIGEGSFLDNVKLRRKGEVDADSRPLPGGHFEIKKSKGKSVIQTKLL